MDTLSGPGATVKPNQVERAQTTYFFEKPDGKIIAATDRQAWQLYARPNQIIKANRQRFKLVGTSDGTLYQKAVLESHEIFKTQGLEAAQKRLREGFDQELAVARGKIIPPPNFDTIGRGGEPVNLATLR